jgi:FGGY-family pentulose kinase
MQSLYLGVDVGTGSVRAGLFDAAGRRAGLGVSPIQAWRPQPDFVEQSSDDIWRAAGIAVRAALSEAAARPERVRGIGFDATCSLVALDAEDAPVSLSPTGRDERNVMVWMDHRALAEADEINRTCDDVLQYVGGVISPEMQVPKLLWLKRHLPAAFARAARFFDLADFLTYRATGSDVRSLCTTVCKWTYLGHENAGAGTWSKGFFDRIGLGELLDHGAVRIGSQVKPIGERAGLLRERAAAELGLAAGIPVGIGIIDAHAGGIGILGALAGDTVDRSDLGRRLALIGGTSSCHMAVSADPRYVPGVWGPYFSAMVPGLWLTEGGQSATGALLDATIDGHGRGPEMRALAKQAGSTVYSLLNERLERLASRSGSQHPAALTRELHVLADHHGNRSPRADPTLRGMVSGLSLEIDEDALARLYLATVQGIAYGTRHIIEALQGAGYALTSVIATGGDAKNSVFVREHADATGLPLLLPEEPESVLLGSAMLGAVASGDRAHLVEAMAAMSRIAKRVEPNLQAKPFHDRKFQVFRALYEHQLEYRKLMSAPGSD